MSDEQYIWEVKVTATKIGWDDFHVNAPDDKVARQKAIKLMGTDYPDEEFEVLYCETKLLTTWRKAP